MNASADHSQYKTRNVHHNKNAHHLNNNMGNASSTSSPSCPSTSSSAPSSECPVQFRTSQPVYNVYGQRVDVGSPQTTLDTLAAYSTLDPTNNMPAEPNQQPFPGQRVPLPTDRKASTIPKGGTQGTWLYPSPQMFYNALRRKGKGDDVRPEDVEAVVYNHNGVFVCFVFLHRMDTHSLYAYLTLMRTTTLHLVVYTRTPCTLVFVHSHTLHAGFCTHSHTLHAGLSIRTACTFIHPHI